MEELKEVQKREKQTASGEEGVDIILSIYLYIPLDFIVVFRFFTLFLASP